MSIDSTTKALSASESNPLPAGRYNVRAAYADRDPLMGGADQVVNTSRVVDVVAGKTTTANFVLAIPLWRARFERALAKPAGHRAALLEQTYRQLKELGATAPSDQPRFTGAASEQQMVRFVMGTLATDVGLEPHVRYKRVDVVSVDGAAQSKAILGGALPWDELVRGRHQFTAVIEVLAKLVPIRHVRGLVRRARRPVAARPAGACHRPAATQGRREGRHRMSSRPHPAVRTRPHANAGQCAVHRGPSD